MELKITKGEWYWKHDDITQSGVTIQSTNGETIVDFVMGKNIFEAEANAKLIAAAPDLLEALNAMKIHFHSWLQQDKNTIGYKHAVKALAAIEKATK